MRLGPNQRWLFSKFISRNSDLNYLMPFLCGTGNCKARFSFSFRVCRVWVRFWLSEYVFLNNVAHKLWLSDWRKRRRQKTRPRVQADWRRESTQSNDRKNQGPRPCESVWQVFPESVDAKCQRLTQLTQCSMDLHSGAFWSLPVFERQRTWHSRSLRALRATYIACAYDYMIPVRQKF